MQTKYINYEIICVDDGSLDDSIQIIKSIAKSNKRIKILYHNKNKGLYQARITGIKNARGKYIGFVDSDDYVSPQFFNKMYNTIKKDKSDIAFAKTVIDAGNVKYIQEKSNEFLTDIKDKDADLIYEDYWKQAGRCYTWHVVWNKVYSIKLIQDVYDNLLMPDVHLIMMEDFVFSSIILSKAKKFSYSENCCYYYVQSDETSTSTKEVQKIINNLADINIAFSRVRIYLEQEELYDRYRLYYREWQMRYSRYWMKKIVDSFMEETDKQLCMNKLKNVFEVNDCVMPIEDDQVYYEKAIFLTEASERMLF